MSVVVPVTQYLAGGSGKLNSVLCAFGQSRSIWIEAARLSDTWAQDECVALAGGDRNVSVLSKQALMRSFVV